MATAELSAGARRAFQAAEKRAETAERALAAADARAKAAESRADHAQALVDRLGESVAAIVTRLERVEQEIRAGRVKAAKPLALAGVERDPIPLQIDQSENADIIWRVKAIAAFLGLSEKSAQHHIDRGEIPSFRMGGTIGSRKSTLTAWIAQQEQGN